MANYVRWVRDSEGKLNVEVAENVEFPHNWKSYKNSVIYVPDESHDLYTGGNYKAKGFNTFSNCVKQGYTVLDLKGDLI